MRPALALAFALCSAASANAQVVQDRYGPPRQRPVPPTLSGASQNAGPAGEVRTARLEPAPAPYAGPLLGWSSKRAEPVRVSAPAAAPPPAPRPQASAPRPSVAPLPDSLYAAPGPRPQATPASPQRAAPPVAVAPQPLAPAPAPPAHLAAAAPSPARAQGGATTHYYSLHREYGLAPDAIPEPPKGTGYVLVGPPDQPKPDTDEAKTSNKVADGGVF